MPLETTYPTVSGVKKKAIGQILAERLEADWDPSKTDMNILKSEIFFESSNQVLDDKNVPDTRNIVVRCHSGRRTTRDFEIGVNTMQIDARPQVHIFVLDYQATSDGVISDLASDMAQYIYRYFAERHSSFQDEGIRELSIVEDTWIPNTEDANWHHWAITLAVQYEMYRS